MFTERSMRIEPQGGENRRFEIERQVVVAGTANDEKWGETKKVAPPFLRFHTPVRKRLYSTENKGGGGLAEKRPTTFFILSVGRIGCGVSHRDFYIITCTYYGTS